MSRQHLDFTVAGSDKDSGEETSASIRPVADGEPGQASVFNRPTENLRTRTEFIRDEIENLKYLSDADRALLLTSSGSITWAGLPTGTFTASSDLTLKPFLAPNTSTASRLIICAGTVGQITIRTKQNGLTGQPRAYSGANDISIDFTGVNSGTGAITVTKDGTPDNNVHITYDSHPTSGTTVNAAPGNSFLTQFNASSVATALGLEAVVEGGGTPVEVGFPTPPASVAATLLSDPTNGIQPAEMLKRYMSGAADAEKHNITPAQLTTFFSDPLNALTEGDVLCIRYDDLVMSLGGGRRQSIDELPENEADLAGANLFLLRRFPARLPGALPVATVVNGNLIFVNGRSYLSGETGPLVSAGASYQGSPASPNSWADGTVVSGPVSFESALDTIIQTLGTKAGGTPGAIKIGFTPSGNIAANTVKGAIEELDSEKAGLALANTFTQRNVITASLTNTNALDATGNGNKEGVKGTGGTTGVGVLGWGNGSAAGVEGLGGTTGPGPGVKGIGGGSASGIGVVGEGTGTGDGVKGTGGGTNGTGVHGVAGATNGLGVHGEGTGTGAGVKGVGAASSTGAGVRGEGGSGGGVGVSGLGGTGAAGVSGLGEGVGQGGKFTGGNTGPSSFATRANGAGISAEGSNAGNSMGVVGQGGSTSTPGTSTLAFANLGLLGIGTGGGDGVVGVSSATNDTAGVSGHGSLGGAKTHGVSGTGNGGGSGGKFQAETSSDTGLPAFGLTPTIGPGTGVSGLGATGTGGGDGGEFFGRMGIGATVSRTGVLAGGAFSQTTGVDGGNGIHCRGGSGTVGDANGGRGILAQGGEPFGTGVGGTGGEFYAGTGGIGVDIIGRDRGNLITTEGDFRIGNPTHRIKMGITTTTGPGEGTIVVAGGANKLNLGTGTTAGDQKTIQISGGLVGVGGAPGTEKLEVTGNISVPAANNYKYAAPKTSIYHLNLFALAPEDPTNCTFVSMGWQNTTATDQYVIGFLSGIPANAVLTSAQVCLANSGTTASRSFDVALEVWPKDSNWYATVTGGMFNSNPAVVSVPSNTNSWYTLTLNSTPANLIFPEDGITRLDIKLPSVPSGYVAFRGLRITYTIVNLVPASG